MDPEVNAPVGGAEAISATAPAPASESLSLQDAAGAMRKWREEQAKPQEPAKAEPAQELAETPSSEPSEEAHAETTAEAEAEELPPIAPPLSWTKEEKDEFATYPREAQEKIARREQERERKLSRSQQEAAEKLKGLTAKEQQAEQARQQYEQALPQVMQTLQTLHAGEFSDIKTMSDVTRLAETDWPRYAKWDAQQKQIAAVQQEYTATQERQAQENKQKWSEFASKEDAAILEKFPDLTDKTKAAKIADGTLATLESVGFTREEFAKAWNGEAAISPRDNRWQQIMMKAALYDQAKVTAAKPAPKPVPPVQRPGVAPARGAVHVAAVEQAREKLSTAKGNNAIEVAAQLYRAQKAARG